MHNAQSHKLLRLFFFKNIKMLKSAQTCRDFLFQDGRRATIPAGACTNFVVVVCHVIFNCHKWNMFLCYITIVNFIFSDINRSIGRHVEEFSPRRRRRHSFLVQVYNFYIQAIVRETRRKLALYIMLC